MHLDPERALAEAIARRDAVTLPLDAIGPRAVLERLSRDGASYRLEVRSEDAEVTVEIGNGLVVGAKATREGRALEGPDAYALMRNLHHGSITVAPLRFPSLANILEPVSELSDLIRPSTLPPPIGADTIELSIPEARPVHVAPDPTMEIELPPELTRRASSAPPPPPREPTPEVAAASHVGSSTAGAVVLPPPVSEQRAIASSDTISPPASEERAIDPVAIAGSGALDAGAISARPTGAARRAWPWAAAVAALLLLGGGTAGYAALDVDTDETHTAAAPRVVRAPAAEDETTDDTEAPSENETGAERGDRQARQDRARRLAREARRLLREGRVRQALPRARRAARLRGHLPYYQVVLGDALAANGRRAAAHRAYRRALRMRPDYGPALRRLGRARSEAASGELATRLSPSERS